VQLDPRILAALQELGIQVPQDLNAIRSAPSFAEAQARLQALKERVNRNFRKLAFELHPDRTGNDPARTERFKALVQVKEDLDKLKLQHMPRPQPMVMHVMWRNPVATTSSASTSAYTAYYQGTTNTSTPTGGPSPLRVVFMRPV